MSRSDTQLTKRRKNNSKSKNGLFSLMEIKPKTEAQRMMLTGYLRGKNLIAYGSAGTGKTYIACYLALRDLQDKVKKKIVIVRSAVPTRDQGFLPGSLDEKMAIYQIPYINIINELCQNGTAWEVLAKSGEIQFMSTSYVRGVTLDDSVIIVDEFQNMTRHEMYSLLTRVGENTQVILCGDTNQTDLNKKKEETCFDWMIKVANNMPDWFELIQFTSSDIVRSEFVKKLIMTTEEL